MYFTCNLENNIAAQTGHCYQAQIYVIISNLHEWALQTFLPLKMIFHHRVSSDTNLWHVLQWTTLSTVMKWLLMNLTIISFLCCQILSEVVLHLSTGEVLAGSRLGHSIPVSGLRKRVHREQIPLNLKFVEKCQNILIQPHSICMDFITSVHDRKCKLL